MKWLALFSSLDLTTGNVYEGIPDEFAEKNKMLRIIDNSGESHRHPRSYFKEVEKEEKEDLTRTKTNDSMSDEVKT